MIMKKKQIEEFDGKQTGRLILFVAQVAFIGK
jgi:hypothetical protein